MVETFHCSPFSAHSPFVDKVSFPLTISLPTNNAVREAHEYRDILTVYESRWLGLVATEAQICVIVESSGEVSIFRISRRQRLFAGLVIMGFINYWYQLSKSQQDSGLVSSSG